MRRQTKILLMIASLFVLLGVIIFVGVMTVLKWDFTKFQTIDYETNEYVISEEYQNVSVVTNTCDVVVEYAETENTVVVCKEQKNINHTVSVENGTLVIKVVDTRKWYEYIGIFPGTCRITLSIPKAECGTLSVKTRTGDVKIAKEFVFESMDVLSNTGSVFCNASAKEQLKIKVKTGDVFLENVTAGKMEAEASTGDIQLTNVNCQETANVYVDTGKISLNGMTCRNLIARGDTGDIGMTNVIVDNKMQVKADTGDVKFSDCDAGEMYIETDTGNVKGSVLSDKIFFAKSGTGSVEVPKSMMGGACEIKTDTGDIHIVYSDKKQ